MCQHFNDVIHYDKDIISPRELDVLVKDKNVAYEFDGMYWHSEENKPDNYHLDKTNACLQKGIKLIHVFESEWKYMPEIAKSYVLREAGIYDRTLDAS